jgi:hypothetical protein
MEEQIFHTRTALVCPKCGYTDDLELQIERLEADRERLLIAHVRDGQWSHIRKSDRLAAKIGKLKARRDL